MKKILFILLVFVSLFVLWVLPTNKYEWMIEQGINTLPEDHNAEIYPIIAIIPVVFLFLYYFFIIKKNFLALMICLGVLIIWFWRFIF